MIQTDDYALMFKYMFPIDKMLSINNIYSNTYMSSLKNIDTIFDATKEQLRQLLFVIDLLLVHYLIEILMTALEMDLISRAWRDNSQ
jgi:hypothetical protein